MENNNTVLDRYVAAKQTSEDINRRIGERLTNLFPSEIAAIKDLQPHVKDIALGSSGDGFAPGSVGWGVLCGLLAGQGFTPATGTPNAVREGNGANTQRGYEVGLATTKTINDEFGAEIDKNAAELAACLKEDPTLSVKVDVDPMQKLMAMLMGGGPLPSDSEFSDAEDDGDFEADGPAPVITDSEA